MNTEERITDLESHMAHQERMISELNDVIYEQQKTIDHLEQRLSKMESMARELAQPHLKKLSEETPPPHY